jgi:hypothetical protein
VGDRAGNHGERREPRPALATRTRTADWRRQATAAAQKGYPHCSNASAALIAQDEQSAAKGTLVFVWVLAIAIDDAFDFSQSHGLRLEWEPFVKSQRLLSGATVAGKGVQRRWMRGVRRDRSGVASLRTVFDDFQGVF